MIRVILFLSIIFVCLNWPPTSAEEMTLNQETIKDSTITPENDEETKNVTKVDHDVSPISTSTDKTKTRKDARSEKDTSKIKSQKSSEDSGNKTPYVSETVSLELDEDEENKDTNSSVKNHESKAKIDSDNYLTSNKSEIAHSPLEGKERETSYMGKLTSNLLMPALKSQNQFGKALRHTNEAIKNIGAGTIEAASGAFNFFKDAASAVIKSG